MSMPAGDAPEDGNVIDLRPGFVPLPASRGLYADITAREGERRPIIPVQVDLALGGPGWPIRS